MYFSYWASCLAGAGDFFHLGSMCEEKEAYFRSMELDEEGCNCSKELVDPLLLSIRGTSVMDTLGYQRCSLCASGGDLMGRFLIPCSYSPVALVLTLTRLFALWLI